MKEIPFCQKLHIKSKGLDLSAESPGIKLRWVSTDKTPLSYKDFFHLYIFKMLFCGGQEWFDWDIIKSTPIVLKEKWNNLAKNCPSSRIRTSDLRMTSVTLQSSALPTELSKET